MKDHDQGRKQGEGPLLQPEDSRLATESHREAGQQGAGVGEVGVGRRQAAGGGEAGKRLEDQGPFPGRQNMPRPVEAHRDISQVRQIPDGMARQPVGGDDIPPHIGPVRSIGQDLLVQEKGQTKRGAHGAGAKRGADQFRPAPVTNKRRDPGDEEGPEKRPHPVSGNPAHPGKRTEGKKTAPAAEDADDGAF